MHTIKVFEENFTRDKKRNFQIGVSNIISLIGEISRGWGN